MSRTACPACDTEIAATAVVCPNCQRLIHSEELKSLAAQAEAARKSGDRLVERQAWRRALTLLPAQSKQRLTLERRLVELEEGANAEPARAEKAEAPTWTRAGGALGALALLAWKAKGILLFALGKLKFLTVGLSKASTFFSFLASFAVYWSLWGWRFALGFLVAMYIHEMGHVAALRRYGIPASAPMFIPGVGAFVRMNRHPATVGEDARIGLAGPEWGFGAALAAYLVYWGTGEPIWAAIGHSAAFLNLFNLLPVWQLDGGRGFAALTRPQRLAVAASFGCAWFLTGEGIVALIGVVAVFRAFAGADLPPRGDHGVLGRFIWLVAAFSTMLLMGAPRA